MIELSEDIFCRALHEDQTRMQAAVRTQLPEVGDVVGHQDHAVLDGVAGNVLVVGSPQIDFVHMNGREAAAAGKSDELGAQVLVNEEPELAGQKKAGPFLKAVPIL